MSKIFNTGETSISLKETYNPEGPVLRECQLRMLEMLIYIDNVCFFIVYSLYFGWWHSFRCSKARKGAYCFRASDGISSSELKAKIMAKTAK